MWQGVIELYADKPWAATAVAAARAALQTAKLPPPATNGNGEKTAENGDR